MITNINYIVNLRFIKFLTSISELRLEFSSETSLRKFFPDTPDVLYDKIAF